MQLKSNERKSNIEILRIILILMVIVLHYNNKDMGGALKYVQSGSFNELVLRFIESASDCAVDAFIIISGFFMVNRKKTNLLKPIVLFLTVSFYQIIVYILLCAIGFESFSVLRILIKVIPLNWYITLYAVLYLISPLINFVINGLSKIELRKYLILGIVIFSILLTVVDVSKGYFGLDRIPGISTISIYGNEQGYTIVNFILLYSIGAYINKYIGKVNKRGKYTLALILSTLIITFGSYFTEEFWNYNNIFIIINATLLVLLFKDINLGCKKAINYISESVLGIYIIHSILLPYLWSYFNIKNACNDALLTMILNMVVAVAALFMCSFIIERLFHIIINKFYDLVAMIFSGLKISKEF